MNTAYFKDFETKIKKNPLRGKYAHEEMMPALRKEELASLEKKKIQPNYAAVLCMFYPKNDAVYFPLILRNSYPGVHSNQVSFPGGRREESDKDDGMTALRECEEEIGIAKEKIEIIRSLTDLYIPPSNFLVKPYLGWCEQTPHFVPQPEEVQQIIEVKVEDLLNESTLITENLTTSYAQMMAVKAFKLNDFVVWGATAMILSEIKHLLKSL